MNGTYSVIFTSPELLLDDKSWINVFRSPTLSETLVALVIDEAHCIIKWYSFIMVIYVFNLGRSFKRASQVKYLGVTFDQYLTWKTHINNLCSRANSVKAFLHT